MGSRGRGSLWQIQEARAKKDDVAVVAYGILLQYPFDENIIFEMTTFITLDKRLVVFFLKMWVKFGFQPCTFIPDMCNVRTQFLLKKVYCDDSKVSIHEELQNPLYVIHSD